MKIGVLKQGMDTRIDGILPIFSESIINVHSSTPSMLCAIDGLDGSGKTTVSSHVAEILRTHGYDPIVMEHPGDGLLGRFCKRLLLERGHLALAGASVFLVTELLVDGFRIRLHPGKCHIVVRYDLSACFLPDSLSKAGLSTMRLLLPKPDVSIMIDVDPSTALMRIECRGGDREMFENVESMERVRSKMRSVSEITVMDGTRAPADTARDVVHMLLRMNGP